MIIALAGRRIDAPVAEAARFPLNNIDAVKEKLTNLFISLQPEALVCSGACGADLLALEVAGQLRIRRSMVIPFVTGVFKLKSVTDRPGNWGDVFDRLCEEIDNEEKVQVLNYPDSDDVYEKTNIEIVRRATQLSEKFDTVKEIVVIIVWEGQPKDKTDTTAHFKEIARDSGFEIREINTLNM